MGLVKSKTVMVIHLKLWWSCVGPAPLENLFNFTVNVFKGANGRKLSSVECHDIVCKIEVVVVGGVRRSGSCLSNLSDDRMRHAKWVSGGT